MYGIFSNKFSFVTHLTYIHFSSVWLSLLVEEKLGMG